MDEFPSPFNDRIPEQNYQTQNLPNTAAILPTNSRHEKSMSTAFIEAPHICVCENEGAS